jgi:hypothetical protein
MESTHARDHSQLSSVGLLGTRSFSRRFAFPLFRVQAWAFNADISRWDVSTGFDFNHMFDGASAFRQDLRFVRDRKIVQL